MFHSKKTLTIISAILFLFVAILYSLTLPNINTGYADSDELIAVAKLIGVVHPPGYPFYSLLAIIFGRLPISWLTFAGRVNFLSVILHAATVVNLFLIQYLSLRGQKLEEKWRLTLALMGALSLAVCFSFWFYGIIAEVFSLNNYFLSLMILILVYWGQKREAEKEQQIPYQKTQTKNMLFLAAALYGLTLSNQQISLLLLPALIFFVLATEPRVLTDYRLIIKSAIFTLVFFLLPYIYLPIAARHEAMINWENPQTLTGLVRSITRQPYREVNPTGHAYTLGKFEFKQTWDGIRRFAQFAVVNYTWPLIGFLLLGWLVLLKNRQWRLLVFFLLGLFGSGLFFSIYSPYKVRGYEDYLPINLGIYERFFLSSPIFFSLVIGFGFTGFIEIMSRIIRHGWAISFTVIVTILLACAITDYRELKQNDFSLGYRFGEALLTSLKPNAILLCNSEHSCFTALYVQQSKNIRPDVLIIPYDFSQWKAEAIKKKYPDLFYTTTPSFPGATAILITRDIIRWNIAKRPIYMSGLATDGNTHLALGVGGNPFYLIPNGCGEEIKTYFSPEPLSASCVNLEAKAKQAYYTMRAPVSLMFYDYFLYQRYFNAGLYARYGCITRAVEEYAALKTLRPAIDLGNNEAKILKSTKEDPQSACFNKSKTVADADKLFALAHEAASKKDIQTAIFLMQQVAMIEPKNLDARLSIAKYFMMNPAGYDTARIELQDVLILDPKNQPAQQLLDLLDQLAR